MRMANTPNSAPRAGHALRLRALVLAMSVVTAACGSTVAVDGQGLPQTIQDAPGVTADEQAQGLTVPTTSPSSDPAVAAGNPGDRGGQAATTGSSTTGTSGTSTTTTGTTDTTGTTGTTGGTTGTTSGSTGPAPGTYGPGITDDEIVIGVAVPDEATMNNNAAVLGVEGVTVGNVERYYDLMAEHVNANGGIAGRSIRLSKWRYSAAGSQSYSQLEQSSCTYWTQDDPAFAVPALFTGETFLGCAQDNGLATWNSTFSTIDQETIARYPTHVELSAMSLTRQGRILAEGLVAQDYFDDGYKLGVVTFDEPSWRRTVDESLEPALNAHGYAIADKAFVKPLSSTSDVGSMTAELQSIVLRFKTQDVTHVIFLDSNATMALLFLRSAENQAYRPRYGMTSQAGGTTLAGLAPEGQLNGALGIGWLPFYDVLPSERPSNPTADACLARFEEQGEEPADENNAVVMLSVCEAIEFVKAAVEAGLPDITASSYGRGAETLGTFPSHTSFENSLAPGRRDGASLYRLVAYDAACVCFHYTSDFIADRP